MRKKEKKAGRQDGSLGTLGAKTLSLPVGHVARQVKMNFGRKQSSYKFLSLAVGDPPQRRGIFTSLNRNNYRDLAIAHFTCCTS